MSLVKHGGPLVSGGGLALISTDTATGTSGTAAVNAPAGRLANDWLLVGLDMTTTVASVGTPSGWTKATIGSGDSDQRELFVRKADGTSTDNFSSSLSDTQVWRLVMFTIRGLPATGTIGAAAEAGGSTPQTVSAPTITMPATGYEVILATGECTAGTDPIALPAGFTALGRSAAALGGTVSEAVVFQRQAAAGATGATNVTMTATSGFAALIAMKIGFSA